MCAIFESKITEALLRKLFQKPLPPFIDISDMDERVHPHSPALVIVKGQSDLEFKKMSYSLVPSWSTTRKTSFATYNARIESITELPTWKTPFVSKRCGVPLTGFVESIHEGDYAGNVVKFSRTDGELLLAAGIWDSWLDRSTGELLESFSIITREPSAFVAKAGHDRSPVFISPEQMDTWLDHSIKEEKVLKEFLLGQNVNLDFKVEIERPLKSANSNQLKLF